MPTYPLLLLGLLYHHHSHPQQCLLYLRPSLVFSICRPRHLPCQHTSHSLYAPPRVLLLQVALVAGVVAVGVFLFNVGRPIVDNTLQSFPSPEQIQAYEDSK
jgi:hypothetical protein